MHFAHPLSIFLPKMYSHVACIIASQTTQESWYHYLTFQYEELGYNLKFVCNFNIVFNEFDRMSKFVEFQNHPLLEVLINSIVYFGDKLSICNEEIPV